MMSLRMYIIALWAILPSPPFCSLAHLARNCSLATSKSTNAFVMNASIVSAAVRFPRACALTMMSAQLRTC